MGIGLGLVLAALDPVQAAAPEPGAPLEVTVSGAEGPVTLRFRYCPDGTLRPGKPDPTAAAPAPAPASSLLSGVGDDWSLAPFFITETEITVGQFRELLGRSAVEHLLERFPQMESTKRIRGAVDRDPTRPIYLVTLEDAVAFCEALRTGYLKTGGAGPSEIVTYRFRIPTHAEWQYAGRARKDTAAAWSLPHFNRWPDGKEALPQEIQRLGEEQWKALGHDPKDFNATQEQVAAILEGRPDDDNALRVLAECLRLGLGTGRSYEKNATLEQPNPVGRDQPNDWQIHDIHDNVSEWVIAAPDPDRAEAIWDSLLNPASASAADRSEQAFLFAGGGFNAVLTGSKNQGWKHFSLWGGAPSDPGTFEPARFSLDDEGASHTNTKEVEPGFRVALRRTLASSWLAAVRRSAVLEANATPALLDDLEAKRGTALEVATASERLQVESLFAYYRALALYRVGRKPEAIKSLSAVRPTPSEGSAGTSRRLGDLLAEDGAAGSAGKPAPAATPKPKGLPASDSRTFLDCLGYLIAREQ
jgi:formylglycine-generating enzyme required for sulfatase activity